MHDLCLIAAQAWAGANQHLVADPVAFGAGVARAYMACRTTQRHDGDERATAAALAALSASGETWQWLAQLAEHVRRPPAGLFQARPLDAEGSAQ